MRLDFINEKEFINSKNISEFTSFFSQIILGERKIHCEYVPKKDKQNKFMVSSFEEGLKQYSWAGQSFSDTQKVITQLSSQLSFAIEENNELLMLQSTLAILEWGQVYRGCIDWLLAHSEKGRLIQSIVHSSSIIDGTVAISSSQFEALFDRNGHYRCNSGTTKIFALCSKQSVIYDGRVACAIGMFVHDFLIENKIDHLPPELNFLMDASQRNPSKYTPSNYAFASKSDSLNSLYNQAVSNLKLNLLLQQITQRLDKPLFGFDNRKDQLRAIEASLFMVGYQVNTKRYENTGLFLL